MSDTREQDEIERLQYMHQIFNMMFDNRLIFPPIPRPRRILECGSGSGAWAMEVAEQYPECEVCEPLLNASFPVPEKTSATATWDDRGDTSFQLAPWCWHGAGFLRPSAPGGAS